MKSFGKIALVIVGAVVLTTLAIEASDIVGGIRGNLTGSLADSGGPCDAGEVLFVLKGASLCVDMYEASAADICPVAVPRNELETRQNIDSTSCVIASKPDALPWRFVSRTEAAQLCARSGKRLLTNEEWYAVVSGSTNVDEQCVVNATAPQPSGSSDCVSPSGVYDLVGNVWEWVDADVQNGVYNNREMPVTGYVAAVDQHGVVTETVDQEPDGYEGDFAWTNETGNRGIIRGGFYDSGTDAGIFSLNSSVSTEFRTTGIGFRCVRDIRG